MMQAMIQVSNVSMANRQCQKTKGYCMNITMQNLMVNKRTK